MGALNKPTLVNKPNNNIQQQLLQSFLYTLLGLVYLSLIFIYIILVSPIFLYRCIITKYIAPLFRPEKGEAVTVLSNFMAAELVPEKNSSSSCPADNKLVHLPLPRNVVVASLSFRGTLTVNEITEAITRGWLTPRAGETELKYPEFQQYPEMWMGFLFWTQDKSFSLENHVITHRLPDNVSKEKSEEYFCDLMETLLNKQFPKKRSPWEVHIIQNCRESSPNFDVKDDNKNQQENYNNEDEDIRTRLICRFHHGLGDGYSGMFACIEGILGINLKDVYVAIPKDFDGSDDNSGGGAQVKKLIYKLWRTVHDAGHLASLHWPFMNYSSVPWFVPDNKKKWKQLYGRSKLIPVDKIKFIKSKLEASFTGVLLSCLEAGAAKSLKQRGVVESQKFPISFPLPMPNHPMKLRNHATATLLEFSVNPNMDSVERLESAHKRFVDARHFSQIPVLLVYIGRLMCFPFARLTKILCPNRFSPTGLSNFPGPGIQMKYNGRDMTELEFCVAGLVGVAGVIFAMISYHGHVRLTVTAEKGVMEREELEKLISYIEMEMDELYERAKQV